jgi:hypothetical protein
MGLEPFPPLDDSLERVLGADAAADPAPNGLRPL